MAGGPYTTVATGVTDLLTFADKGLGAGTYDYVITAVTPSGETVASNEAAAVVGTLLHTYLALDEATGTGAADSTGDGHTGTLVGGATWAAGKRGGAVSLNGTNGYISLPPDLVRDVSDVTIAAWVYWRASRASEHVFDFGSNIDHYMALTARSTTGVARFAITVNGVSGEQVINSNAALPIGQWVHVAVTLSGNVGTLYVNGQVVGTNTAMLFSPFRLGGTSQNWIGRSQTSTDPYFNGVVDDFRLYWGALTGAQIGALSAG
jgi:hypothetical protein